MATKIQLRRDTSTNWQTNNPTPAAGEPCFETDTGKLKIGDGTKAYNDLAYQGSGSSDAPENMVTTDTEQTISGKKTFLQGNSSNAGLNIALGSSVSGADNTIHIGRASSSDFTGGVIRFDSTAAKIVGLQQTISDGTLKLSSSGHLTTYGAGNTYIQNGAAWSSSKSGIHIPAYSATNPSVEIVGGTSTVSSSSGSDASIRVGFEGTGTWTERKGVFIKTDAKTNGADSGAKLWLGAANTRSAIYPVSGSSTGRCLNMETYVGDNTNATLSIQPSDIVYTDKDGTAYSLIAGGGANTSLSNLNETGLTNLADKNCYDIDTPTSVTVGADGAKYEIPKTGLLVVSGTCHADIPTDYIQINNAAGEHLAMSRGSLISSTVTASIRVKKGQTVAIRYNTENTAINIYPCLNT